MMKIGKMLEYGEQKVVHGKIKDLLNAGYDNVAVIASKTSFEKARDNLMLDMSDFPCQVYWSESKPFSTYIPTVGNKKVYIGFGGGTAIDIAKYLAAHYGAKCIAVPTMLSTNVFATNKVAEILVDSKTTVDSVLPEEVWVDTELLKLSMKENMYGLADTFSIGTALIDWGIADNEGKEQVDKSIFEKAEEILFKGLEITLDDDIDLQNVYNIISASGYITNIYGSGRPESGSEHILAKEIEKQIKIPHAVAVCCGIAIMGFIQPKSLVVSKIIPDRLRKLGLYDDVKRLVPREVMVSALQNLKPRKDRFTIIDMYPNGYFKKFAERLIEESKLYD